MANKREKKAKPVTEGGRKKKEHSEPIAFVFCRLLARLSKCFCCASGRANNMREQRERNETVLGRLAVQ